MTYSTDGPATGETVRLIMERGAIERHVEQACANLRLGLEVTRTALDGLRERLAEIGGDRA